MDKVKEKKLYIVGRVLSDVIILGAGGVTLLLFRFLGNPYKRGFFCDDESLNHPYKESTVPAGVLYGVGFAFGAILIIIIEAIWIYRDTRENRQQKNDIDEYGRLPILVRDIYLSLVPFVFGAVLEHIITDTGKYSIGRLRPHFFTVCNLDYTKFNCSDGYIVDFECSNLVDNRVREVRLSFPSGHASFSSFVAAYLIIYLQRRLTFLFNTLIRPLLQTLLFCMAWYTCLSRISDYKHHPTDVLAGGIIGVVSAFVTAYCVSDLFKIHETRQNFKEQYGSLHKVRGRSEAENSSCVNSIVL